MTLITFIWKMYEFSTFASLISRNNITVNNARMYFIIDIYIAFGKTALPHERYQNLHNLQGKTKISPLTPSHFKGQWKSFLKLHERFIQLREWFMKTFSTKCSTFMRAYPVKVYGLKPEQKK